MVYTMVSFSVEDDGNQKDRKRVEETCNRCRNRNFKDRSAWDIPEDDRGAR